MTRTMDAQLRDSRGRGCLCLAGGGEHQRWGHPSQPGRVLRSLEQVPTTSEVCGRKRDIECLEHRLLFVREVV